VAISPPEGIPRPDFDGYLMVDGLKVCGALEVAKGGCNDHLLRRCNASHEVVSAKESFFGVVEHAPSGSPRLFRRVIRATSRITFHAEELSRNAPFVPTFCEAQ
jgi:hypothetical protein